MCRKARVLDEGDRFEIVQGKNRRKSFTSIYEYQVVDSLGAWRATRRNKNIYPHPSESSQPTPSVEYRSSKTRDEHYRGIYALKTPRSLHSRAYLENEIEALRELNHPNVSRIVDCFELKDRLFMVTDVCAGGDLNSRDPYPQSDARRILRMVLSAVSHMHSKNVVHRDLKYENVMFVSSYPESQVRIIDFGSSKLFRPNDYLQTVVGSIPYMAPQVFNGKYTAQADLWSVGVLAYMLLSSQLPFVGDSRDEIIEKIRAGRYNIQGRRWKCVSQPSKDLVSGLLHTCEDVRFTASEALVCPYFQAEGTHRKSISARAA